MNYKPYDKYKDFGIDWLGEIPESWRFLVLRRISEKVQTGGTPPSGDINYFEDGNFNWYSPGDFWGTTIDLKDSGRKINEDAILNNVVKIFPKDTVYIVGIGTIGRVGISKEPSSANQQINAIIINQGKSYPRFIAYSLLAQDQQMIAISNATILGIMNQDKTKQIKLCIPPLAEQKAIANFLDRKTKEIDDLIAKKEELLKLLAEQRTALITNAVTKGLNPNAKMKDVGIAWLGDIPEGWDVKPLKYTTLHNTEILSESTNPDFNIKYVDISSVNLLEGIIKIEEFEFEKSPSRARRIVRDGDTIVSTVRTYLKSITPIKDPIDNLIVSTGFAVIRPTKIISANYLGYFLQSEGFIGEVVSRSVGVSYPAINASDLVKIESILPTKNEQKAIADFLDKKTAEIDKTTTKTKEAIEKLKEYRTSLITNAVTGKINVLNFSGNL